jgi:hypothetical protein
MLAYKRRNFSISGGYLRSLPPVEMTSDAYLSFQPKEEISS